MDPQDVEITYGMMQWEPGSLGSNLLTRITQDALADLWQDCYRASDGNSGEQRRRFRRQIEALLYASTDQEWRFER